MNPLQMAISSFEDYIQLPSLRVWYDLTATSSLTKSFITLSQTSSGTSGTTTLTASLSVAATVAVGSRIRVNGADIYTVAAVSTVTITTNETLVNTYIASTLEVDVISNVADKSGYANDATQSTDVNKPRFIPSANNGLAASGHIAGHYFTMPSALYSIPNGDNTLFVVAKSNSDSTQQNLICMMESSSSRWQCLYSSISGQVDFQSRTASGSAVSLTGVTKSNFNIFTCQLSSTTQSISLNNAAAVTNSSGAYENGINGARIGRALNDTSSFNGFVLESLVYNEALTAAQIININRLLAAKHSIAIS